MSDLQLLGVLLWIVAAAIGVAGAVVSRWPISPRYSSFDRETHIAAAPTSTGQHWFDVARFREERPSALAWEQEQQERALGIRRSGPEILAAALEQRVRETRRRQAA